MINKEVNCIIIGAGLCGLSTAYHLNSNYIVLEKEKDCGGTAGTLHYKGFKLDKAVHILYFRDPSIRKFISSELGIQLLEQVRDSRVYIKGRQIPFPLQYNLSELPLVSKTKIVFTIFYLLLFSKKKFIANNFEEWAVKNFGKELYRIFFNPYNRKLWGIELNKLKLEWMDQLIPKVSFDLFMKGLIRKNDREYGFNSVFYYPEKGGIASVSKKIEENLTDINYSVLINKIDQDKKLVSLKDGTILKYNYLVNTSPLKNFISYLSAEQKELFHFSSKLKSNCTNVAHLLFNQINCNDVGMHWLYVPDPKKNFYRITFPRNICKANCPTGKFAMTIEFGGKINDYKLEENLLIRNLIEMRLIDEKNHDYEIIWDQIPVSYVIYDSEMTNAKNHLHSYLNSKNIFSIGRYGSWEYSNMESALLQGKKTAELINNLNGKN